MYSIARTLILALILTFFVTGASALENGVYRDKAEGYGGDVIVTVIVRDGQMMELTTENTGGEKSEYYLKAEEALTQMILEKQGIDGIDTVAGATGTSESILAAMQGILEQANYTGAPLGMVNDAAQDAADAVEGVTENAVDAVENTTQNVVENMTVDLDPATR